MSRIGKIGLVILVTGIMALGYGGWCKKKSSSSSGSSGTLPAQVTSPNPADEATDVSTDTGLTWATASGATSYDVYAGTVNPPTEKVITDTTETSLAGPPGGLEPLTTYYWRVDAKNSAGTTTGIVWNFTTGLAPTYSISGNIAYAGAKTGRIFINVYYESGGGTYFGTSISPTGTYTIRGVGPGNYMLRAWMDHIGQGLPNASNPVGNSAPVTVTDSSLIGVDITLTDPTPPSAIFPTGLAVIPGDESVFIVWNATMTTVNGGEMESGESYNIYCGDSGVSKGSFTVSATMAAQWDYHFLLDGLTNGNDYYFVVTTVVDGGESVESDTFGPVTPNPPVGGQTVSGEVSFPVEAEGGKTMWVAVYSETGAGVFWTITSTLTSPMAYEVLNVADGTFYAIAFIDMNENGEMDLGDISNMGPEGEPSESVTVAGASVTKDITLTGDNAGTYVGTLHWKTDSEEAYWLDMGIAKAKKLPVKVVLTAGPNVAVPMDIGYRVMKCDAMFNLSSIRQEMGQTYTFDVTYLDGTNEILNASVTGVLDCFAIDLTTTGSDDYPTFNWNAPLAPPDPYTYWLEIEHDAWGCVWEYPSKGPPMPSSQTSVDFDCNGEADPSPLPTGETYYWMIGVVDSDGNMAIYGKEHTVP